MMLLWNFLDANFSPIRFRVEDQHFHSHQIDNRSERIIEMWRTLANGNLHRDGVRVQSRSHFLDDRLPISPFAIELVDEADPRHVILVGLPPDGFTLRFDPLAGAEYN